jgi:hypothetical protein
MRDKAALRGNAKSQASNFKQRQKVRKPKCQFRAFPSAPISFSLFTLSEAEGLRMTVCGLFSGKSSKLALAAEWEDGA